MTILFNIKLWEMTIEIVDFFSIEHGGFPVRYASHFQRVKSGSDCHVDMWAVECW